MGRMSVGNLKHCAGVAGDRTAIVFVSADDDGEEKNIQPRFQNGFKRCGATHGGRDQNGYS